MTDDESAIRELVETWMAASKAGDLATVLDLMADDVLFMTPNREPFGKSEFQESFESMKGAEVAGTATIEEVQVAGDWAWIRNHIDLTVRPAGGPSIRRSGYTLTVLRKSHGGSWQLFRDANFVS
jgi:uncharacterized protein (TIGR02246 family)